MNTFFSAISCWINASSKDHGILVVLMKNQEQEEEDVQLLKTQAVQALKGSPHGDCDMITGKKKEGDKPQARGVQ